MGIEVRTHYIGYEDDPQRLINELASQIVDYENQGFSTDVQYSTVATIYPGERRVLHSVLIVGKKKEA